MVSFQATNAINKRSAAKRHDVTHYTQIRQGGFGSARGWIRNMSTGGLQIECYTKLSPRSKVYIEIPGLQPVTAEVRWVKEPLYGCQFIYKLHPAVVEHLIREIG